MAEKFHNQPHGKITCEVIDNVLYNYPQGAFNREGIIKGWNQILNTVAEAGLEKWLLLDQIDPDNLFTPDGMIELTNDIKNAKQQGLQGVAVLCHNVVQRDVFSKMLQNAGVPYTLADDIETAEKWIKDRSGNT